MDRRSFLKAALAGTLVLSARQRRAVKDELLSLGEDVSGGLDRSPDLDQAVLDAVRESLRDHVSAHILPPVKTKRDLPKRADSGSICYVEKEMAMYSCLGGKLGWAQMAGTA